MKLGSGVSWRQVTEWCSNTQKAAIKPLTIIQIQTVANKLYLGTHTAFLQATGINAIKSFFLKRYVILPESNSYDLR
jgi:hypothetical protein|tara:strand:+ start:144 stop:374 length:231 start_codon:yes stop_codon:yes gene_type:complete